ncbi:cuticle protein 21 [Nasonia vitripennis]|uniref:Uncharacterized protein n=1 Tax=Nasonia vitripennis TaxID=7425 RepID=A0A7M7G500_NASVI|nr:cuticle protein 21 [Nasonia vitripennis]
MSKLLVISILFIGILCHFKALSQYASITANGVNLDPCNARELPEKYRDPLVICSPPSEEVKKYQVPIYENPLYQESSNAFEEPSGTEQPKPRSFTRTQHEIRNKDAEFAIYPKYSYNYGVVDGNTGDTKAAWEERDGDTVRGEYSVMEADGSIRTVTYTADDKNGFNAVVTRTKPSRVTAESAIVRAFLPLPMQYKRERHRTRH